jgi:signal transduction histidine kinase
VVEVARETAGTQPAGRAVLDQHGIYLELDDTARDLLGLRGPGAADAVGSAGFAPNPADAHEVWWLEQRREITPVPLVCSLAVDPPGNRWALSLTPAPDESAIRETVWRYAEQAIAEVATRDLDAMIHTLSGALGRLCGFVGCLIVLIDEQTGEPVFAGGEGMAREHLAALQENRRRGAPMVIWQAFEENRIVVKREWVRHVRQDPRLAPIRAFVEVESNPGLAFLAIPMRCAGRQVGVVTGSVQDPAMITPGRVSLWCRLAEQTALALGYAEAIRAARASGGDRERRRLNEELHDTVGQDVFALKLLAARAEVIAHRASGPEVAGLVSELRALANTVDSGMRGLIGERRRAGPVHPLSEQLAGLAREGGSRSGVDVEVLVSGDWDHLSADCGETVVRIAAEALHNIEKHAHARTAALHVTADEGAPGMLLIEVTDDGQRFDPDAVSSASFGLTFIRERAAGYGGSVEVSTDPRTTLRVRLRPAFESEWDAAVHG